MEKKPKIANEYLNISGNVIELSSLQINKERGYCQFLDSKFAYTKPILGIGSTKEEAKENAESAQIAINCTYGANINPEMIQELIDKTEALINKFGQPHEWPWNVSDEVTSTLQALNNIKYK